VSTVPPDEDDFLAWVHDAREHGAPALGTGLVLLWLVLGVPFWLCALILMLLITVVLVSTARLAFSPENPGSESW
jgi:hypothetical protein